MVEKQQYEVVQGRTGWSLRLQGRAQLVEFPTRRQAVRAGLAVCRDEGVARLVVRQADGVEEELDTLVHPLDGFEA